MTRQELGLEICMWLCIVAVAACILKLRAVYLLLVHACAWFALAIRHTSPTDTDHGDANWGYRLSYTALTLQTALVIFEHIDLTRDAPLRPRPFFKWCAVFALCTTLIQIVFIFSVDGTRIMVSLLFVLLGVASMGPTMFQKHKETWTLMWSLCTLIFFLMAQAIEIGHASIPDQTWNISLWSIHYIVWILLSMANICALMHDPDAPTGKYTLVEGDGHHILMQNLPLEEFKLLEKF